MGATDLTVGLRTLPLKILRLTKSPIMRIDLTDRSRSEVTGLVWKRDRRLRRRTELRMDGRL